MDIMKLRIECHLSAWTGTQGNCQWCDTSIPETSRRTVWCSNKCRLSFDRNHIWRNARSAAKRRDKYTCVQCGKHKNEVSIEVNHIVPLVGKGYAPSCMHHQDNLEVLCHEDHLAVTKQQMSDRKNKTLDNN